MKLTYTNPVWNGYLADPHVMQWNGAWYAYGTALDKTEGDQFAVLRSDDFQHWEPMGYALKPVEGISVYWAPEVMEHRGRFYLYYAGNYRLRVAVSDDPIGPFIDAGVWLLPDEDFSIDASPFQDPASGQWHLFFAKDFYDRPRVGTGIAVVQLAPDLMSVAGPVRTVFTATHDWMLFEKNRNMNGKHYDWHTVEGPTVIWRNGIYHLFYSGSNWETPHYGVAFATATDILGPWTDGGQGVGPTVLKGGSGGLVGPGHNTVILGPDGNTYFNVYHNWNPEGTQRQMCLDPIVWTEDGPTTYQPSIGTKTITLPLPEFQAKR